MPRKEFESFTRLDASDVNTFLMDQSVMTFAGTAARGSAIPTPVEGMVTYLEDSNSFEYWDSAEWDTLAPPSPSGNAIINGAFDIWQRGTSFTGISDGNYSADRFKILFNGTGVRTISRETFTPGAAPISGYEGAFFLRVNQTTAGTGSTFNILAHPIESVRTFAGQTVTLSFFAKANTAKTITARLVQIFGGGGSPSALTLNTSNDISLSTDWERFTFTTTLDSLSGKTLGTDGTDHVRVDVRLPLNDTFTIDIWGVQLETGSVATPFRRNANSLQGELAACQRYFWRNSSSATANFKRFGTGQFVTSDIFLMVMQHPVTMRAAPTLVASGTWSTRQGDTQRGTGAPAIVGDGTDATSSALHSAVTGATAGNGGYIRAENSSVTFLDFSAEL